MATERLYGLTGKTPAKAFAGQAAIVFRAMGGENGLAPEFKTAKAWTELIEETAKTDPAFDLKTRQDPYRVVLYYLLIFKKRELVASRDFSSLPVTGPVALTDYTVEDLQRALANLQMPSDENDGHIEAEHDFEDAESDLADGDDAADPDGQDDAETVNS